MLTPIDLASMSRGSLENLLAAVEDELQRRAQENSFISVFLLHSQSCSVMVNQQCSG
jgi:hypothetical protein